MTIDPTASVHPSAVVEDGAEIGPGCQIGAFAVIGPDVRLAARVEIKSHAVITGATEIGEESVIFPFATLGEAPQDLKYKGEKTRLVIGARNRVREGATMNIGTDGGGGVTRVGDDCLFMTGAHVAHDAQVGNRVILANQVALAGHCVVEDDVILGGLAAVHQFCRVGRGAIIGGITRVVNDVIPYGFVSADDGALQGLNLVGLKRRGVGREDISALRAAYEELAKGKGTFAERAERIGAADSAYVREISEFILAGTNRHFVTPS